MQFSNSIDLSKIASDAPRDPSHWGDRLQLEYFIHPHEPSETEFSPDSDVVNGLQQSPKTLPPRYFYDDRGSQLFEQICELPEYYPTRTEAEILRQYASEITHATGPCELVELGSGSSTKTRLLLDAYCELGHSLHYLPVDVSAGILEASAEALLADYPSLSVCGLVSTYELALQNLPPTRLPSRAIAFIGSSLGNLSPAECDEFFTHAIEALQPGDDFLLGIDLQKPKKILEAAYNDGQGVTAAFNLNMLRHLNRRFNGNFDLSQFEHFAFYNDREGQVEMRLRSLRSQTVELQTLDLTVEFEAGETILTEISRKFDLDRMQQYLHGRGLEPVRAWTDSDRWFGLLLCQLPA